MSNLAPGALLGALTEARDRTLALVAPLSDHDIERVTDPLMSPLAWDLAHIAACEGLWLVHRHGGEPLLHPELAAMYDAFETPRAVRGDVPLLHRAGAPPYLARGGPAAARPRRGARLPGRRALPRAGDPRPPRRRRRARDGAPARAAAHR